MATYVAFPNTTTQNSANQNAAEPTVTGPVALILLLTGTYVAVPRTLTIGSGGGQAGYATGG